MERIVNLHIGKLPEGVYLATSDAIQGLVMRGRTMHETIEIGHDDAKQERDGESSVPPARDEFNCLLIVNI